MFDRQTKRGRLNVDGWCWRSRGKAEQEENVRLAFRRNSSLSTRLLHWELVFVDYVIMGGQGKRNGILIVSEGEKEGKSTIYSMGGGDKELTWFLHLIKGDFLVLLKQQERNTISLRRGGN